MHEMETLLKSSLITVSLRLPAIKTHMEKIRRNTPVE